MVSKTVAERQKLYYAQAIMLRARRRQAEYEKVIDELDDITDDSDLNDEKIWYPNQCKKVKNCHSKRYLEFRHSGTFDKNWFLFGKTIFPGKYFVTGWQAGTWVFIRESFGLKNVHLGAIWVPPMLKMPLCHSGTKFHIFRLPNNIGLDMPNIFGNSDAQYIWGFRIAFNWKINQFFGHQILKKPCFVIPGHYGCPGGFLQKSSTYRWDKKEKGFWNVFLVQKHIRDLLSDIFDRRNHVFYHPYHTVPEWQNDCFGNVTAKIYHEDNVTE